MPMPAWKVHLFDSGIIVDRGSWLFQEPEHTPRLLPRHG